MSNPNLRAVNLKGEGGGVYIAAPGKVVGPFDTVLCLADAVVDLSDSNLTGAGIDAVEIPAGVVVWGAFNSVNPASGAIFAYRKI